MKRLALVAAVLAMSACAKKDEVPADTAAAMAAPAMAPAPMDSGMKMDSGMMKMDTGMKKKP